MIDDTHGASFIAAASFEPRCMTGPAAFLEAGGSADAADVVTLGGGSTALAQNVEGLQKRGFSRIAPVDRLNTRSLWRWAWRCASNASRDVVVDATCIPRELLAMVLFGLSVRRESLDRVRVLYTAPERYVTLLDLPEEEKWLSRGIHALRTILGYPGDFASERNRHVVALAGHEDDRMLEVIEFLEPTRLSIGSEQKNSSTVAHANQISEKVKAHLRERMGHPEYGDVVFYADSIDGTLQSLKDMLLPQTDENVALIAMNTKLSFIGAALCALQLRHIRFVYAVPVEYNPHYSEGVRDLMSFDITEAIRTSATTPVRSAPGGSIQQA